MELGRSLENLCEPAEPGSWRPKTYGHYEWLVTQHLIPAIGREPLAKLAPSDVDALLKQ